MNSGFARLLFSLALAPICGALAQAEECRWAGSPIQIDGKADEAAWAGARWITNFQAFPGGGPAKSSTRSAMLWDHEAFYFFAELEDRDLFADVTEHDGQTWDNDVFELFLQPDLEQARYYEFQVNAANTQFDMMIDRRHGEPFEIKRWVGAQTFHMRSAVVLGGTLNERADRDTGWAVEGRIPWSDFAPTGGRPSAGAEWRFLNSRYDFVAGQRPELSASAVLPPRGGFHQPAAWGTLRFVGAPRWNNKTLRGSPEARPPFRTKRVYSGVRTHSGKTEQHEAHGPVAVKRQPNSRHIWFLENYGYSELRGVLRRFEADPHASSADLLLELNEYAYSFTFHPKFKDNGFVFVGVNGPDAQGQNHTRIVRYTFSLAAERLLPDSRKVIIEWPSSGHNGGDCAFGADGMLYATSGDGTSGMDTDKKGQDLSSLLSKVLRIDVDLAEGDEPYRVPADNPFVGMEGVRPETWAYGLRNPWRITSDPVSGQIWIGENGQDLREYAHLVRRGANYGWSAYEGSRKLFPERLRGPSGHTAPTVEHDHSKFRSLTGGIVYRGREFPELEGAYLYGDFSTGRIWAILHDGANIAWHRELADTPLAVVAFGEDADGEPLIADYGGGFHRLERRPMVAEASAFPRLLSETGLYVDLPALVPAQGVMPYQINLPGWHDGASGAHWVALPDGASIHPAADSPWSVDDGAALVQTLFLNDRLRRGRRVETRILLKQENDWAAYTYVWNDAQSDAELAPDEGKRIAVPVAEGTRPWLVPSRSECLMCHSRAANFALTLKTAQFNHDDQIARFHAAGFLSRDTRGAPHPRRSSGSLEERARAYLAVNCAHCHTADGGGNSAMEMLASRKLEQAGLINEVPQHGAFGLKDARIITPGAPSRSVLVTRMALRIPGQMPPIGSLRPDMEGVRLISAWISSLRREHASAGEGPR